MIALNGSTIMTTPLEAAVQAAAQAGFQGYELRIPHVLEFLEDHSVASLARLFTEFDVSPLSINAIEGFNTPDDSKFHRLLEIAQRQTEIAHEINCPYLIFVPEPSEMPWTQVCDVTRNRLETICELTKGSGVMPLLEFIGFPEFGIRTVDQAVRTVTAVESGKVGIVLDTFHFAIAKQELGELKPEWVNHVELVHLDDVEDVPQPLTDENRVFPGDGVGGLQDVVAWLRQGGYTGPYSVELFRKSYWALDANKIATMAYRKTFELLATQHRT